MKLNSFVSMSRCLGALEDIDALSKLPTRVEEALDDLEQPLVGVEPVGVEELPEREIAGLMAELLSEEFWARIETSEDDPEVRPEMASTALELYERTRPWTRDVFSGSDFDSPAAAAVSLIQVVIDICAAHSQSIPEEHRSWLPSREQLSDTARVMQLDEWAAKLQHPLPAAARDATPLVCVVPTGPAPRPGGPGGEFPLASFAELVCHYRLRWLMYSSPTARKSINQAGELRKRRSVFHLVWSYELSRGASRAGPEVMGAAAVCIRIAETLFHAAHSQLNSSAELLIAPEDIRRILKENNSLDWLQDHGFALPGWLHGAGS